MAVSFWGKQMYRAEEQQGKSVGAPKKNQTFVEFFVDFLKLMIIILSCMDMHNDGSMAMERIRAEIGDRKVVAGAKQLRKALRSGQVFRVYLARNADPAITEPLESLCKQSGVGYAWAKTMQDLGKACGIEVGAAAAATLN